MTGPVPDVSTSRDTSGWPGAPRPIRTLHDGSVSFVDAAWRHLGMVTLSWQPSGASRFWAQRGVASILIDALARTPATTDGPTLLDHLEGMGLSVRVAETQFACDLAMTGDYDALLRAIPLVEQWLAGVSVSPDALIRAARAFAQDRRSQRKRRLHAAETRRWRTAVDRPARLWRDFGADSGDIADAVPLLATETNWRHPTNAVVIGQASLAEAWQRATCWGAATAEPRPRVAPRTPASPPGRVHTLRPSADGGALVSYGAVQPVVSIDDIFLLELALETLAGWTGSVLNVVLREELALTYSVYTISRISRVDGLTLLDWRIDALTTAGDVDRLCTQIDHQITALVARPPDQDETRGAARRVIRRSRLAEDSIAGIMANDGRNAQVGLPQLATQRWQMLSNAGTAQAAAGLRRVRDDGLFVVVGSGPIETGEQ